MDVKDLRKTEHPDFQTPHTIEGALAIGKQEKVEPKVREMVDEQKPSASVEPSVPARVIEDMTAKELEDLGLPADTMKAEGPDRQKQILNALIEAPVKINAPDVGTQAADLQDLAFGLEEKK